MGGMTATSPSAWRLRRLFKRPVLFLGRLCASASIRPDSITYMSLLMAFLGLLALVLFHSGPYYGVFVFLTGLLDGVDGATARVSGRSSLHGAFIDSTVDKVAEVVLLVAVALAFSTQDILGVQVSVWVCVCLAGWLMTSYTRSRAENLGVADLDVGLGGRSERLFVLFIFSVVDWVLWGLVAVTVIGLFTAGYRVMHYGRSLRAQDSASRNERMT
ncbi:MAG: CDP-alcohol phosphatidyltransferase family protein [Candidatus Thorarchaeota archaeon]|nr:CDP-alcohol phosphatidyltransferase family protein [Candidatus Thorarchaeota archaeon]